MNEGFTGDRRRFVIDVGITGGIEVMPGVIEAVFIAPSSGEPMVHHETVEAVADRGLRGDRYFAGTGTYSDSARDTTRHVSLIESEAIEAIERDYDVTLEPGEHRRNVVTTGIGLNRLVGKRFEVGDAVCDGVELCEPCSYLEDLVGQDRVLESLIHRGGLRARIVETGDISTGDTIRELDGVDASDAARSRLRDR